MKKKQLKQRNWCHVFHRFSSEIDRFFVLQWKTSVYSFQFNGIVQVNLSQRQKFEREKKLRFDKHKPYDRHKHINARVNTFNVNSEENFQMQEKQEKNTANLCIF